MNYYISDMHLGHKNVIEYSNRPFVDTNDMNLYMVMMWNSKIKKSDDVYILGDLAFGKNTLKKWVSILNGKKHLIKGNHDRVWLNKVTEEELQKNFVEIIDYKVIKDEKREVVLFHYPIMDWDKKHYGSFHLHGHIHNRESEAQEYSRKTENMYNVGADLIGFIPVTLDELINGIAYKDTLYNISDEELKILNEIGKSYLENLEKVKDLNKLESIIIPKVINHCLEGLKLESSNKIMQYTLETLTKDNTSNVAKAELCDEYCRHYKISVDE